MKKFEYKVLSSVPHYFAQDEMNCLGADGWEAFNLTAFREDGNEYYKIFFKREIPS